MTVADKRGQEISRDDVNIFIVREALKICPDLPCGYENAKISIYETFLAKM